jgi:hypothetical protein
MAVEMRPKGVWKVVREEPGEREADSWRRRERRGKREKGKG